MSKKKAFCILHVNYCSNQCKFECCNVQVFKTVEDFQHWYSKYEQKEVVEKKHILLKENILKVVVKKTPKWEG